MGRIFQFKYIPGDLKLLGNIVKQGIGCNREEMKIKSENIHYFVVFPD